MAEPPVPVPVQVQVPVSETPSQSSSSSSSSCWSNIVKNQPPPKPIQQHTPQLLFTKCDSSNGISLAVVDANAVIESGEKLHSFADKFVSVPEVIDEIRDPVSRHKLSFLPFTIDTMEPTPESINKVVKFARATGDLQTLSDVDIKLIALTYTLEAQIHGTKHLRDIPPPVKMLNVKRLPEKDMPGWGSNVPNLKEWEALEEAEDKTISDSRILPLQDLNLNTVSRDDLSEDGSVDHKSETPSEIQEGGSRKPKKYQAKKKEINIEGKMVADGVDASQGQFDNDDGDWMPAVSRSTHRRFLRRKARREYNESLFSQDQQELEENIDDNVDEDARASNDLVHQTVVEKHTEKAVDEDNKIIEENGGTKILTEGLKQMRLEEGLPENLDEKHTPNNAGLLEPEADSNVTMASKPSETDTVNDQSNHFETASEISEATEFTFADDDSEQSWGLRSLSESSVACVTADFAMQNVLLQMGLRLLAPGGTQIHQLHRWILKCHACFTVTAEIGRIFCPKCGNGGTLRKVAVTVGENGIILAARRPRVTIRGTKFSLPLPKGGRDSITKNLILREDQIPQRILYPKTKKGNKKDDDFFTADSVFSSHHTDKKASFQQPSIGKALSAFRGRRNPNDNHYSRSKYNK